MTDTYPADFGPAHGLSLTAAKNVALVIDNGDPMRYDGTPDGIKQDNDLRACWGLLALSAYAKRTYGKGSAEPWEAMLSDLVSDLMHLSDAVGADVEAVLSTARRNYEGELRGIL